MIFEYVAPGNLDPVPDRTLTPTDLGAVMPFVMEVLTKIEPSAAGVPTIVIQMKLDANVNEVRQEENFLQRFPRTATAEYKRDPSSNSIFHLLDPSTATPLDRIIYIVRV